MLYDRYNGGKFFLEENNFEIVFATLVPIPENIGRLKMTKYIDYEVSDVPLELIDSERKASELKFWHDKNMPLDADSFTMYAPKNYSSLFIEGEATFPSKFTMLNVTLELCEAYKSKDECASNDEKNYFFWHLK